MIEYSGDNHICAANESFDGIALMIYGDERYAADLMNANPDYCGMSVFNGGETLRLPVVEADESDDESAMANTNAPWKS